MTFRLIGDYYETNEVCCATVSVVRGGIAQVINGIAAAQGRVGIYTGAPSDRIQAASPNRNYGEKVKDWGLSGRAQLGSGRRQADFDHRLSRLARAAQPGHRLLGHRSCLSRRLQDPAEGLHPGSPLPGFGLGGVLDWLVGGFYLHEQNDLTDTVRVGNDANLYVDSVFNALAGPSFGGKVQFYGSLGPTVPTPGAVFLNPAVPNSLPALQAVYGATLAPLVGCFRAQAGTAPGSLCVIPGFLSTPISASPRWPLRRCRAPPPARATTTTSSA